MYFCSVSNGITYSMMSRHYKITYKTYLNKRLKKVSFHGQQTYPLYIQVSYRGQTIFFKSYYFDLFADEKYTPERKRYGKRPLLADIEKMEEVLLAFVIKNIEEDFSFDIFRRDYSRFGKDMCSMAEEGFLTHAFVFFIGRGMPTLGSAVFSGSRKKGLHALLQDMQSALKDDLYSDLVSYSMETRVYLAFYEFVQSIKKPPYLYLSLMEWETGKTAEDFRAYVLEKYPTSTVSIIRDMDKFVAYYFKKEL